MEETKDTIQFGLERLASLSAEARARVRAAFEEALQKEFAAIAPAGGGAGEEPKEVQPGQGEVEPGKEKAPEQGKEKAPEPGKEMTPEQGKEKAPEQGKGESESESEKGKGQSS